MWKRIGILPRAVIIAVMIVVFWKYGLPLVVITGECRHISFGYADFADCVNEIAAPR
jgi:hypothetical protein